MCAVQISWSKKTNQIVQTGLDQDVTVIRILRIRALRPEHRQRRRGWRPPWSTTSRASRTPSSSKTWRGGSSLLGASRDARILCVEGPQDDFRFRSFPEVQIFGRKWGFRFPIFGCPVDSGKMLSSRFPDFAPNFWNISIFFLSSIPCFHNYWIKTHSGLHNLVRKTHQEFTNWTRGLSNCVLRAISNSFKTLNQCAHNRNHLTGS